MTNYDSRFDLDDSDMSIHWIDKNGIHEINGIEDPYDNMGDSEDEYDDGQPDEYTEWQDYMGGDDWDFGQYDGEW